jgi:hypothetical protein
LVVRTSFGFGDLTVDVGLLPLGVGLHTIRLLVDASQALAFTLCGRALALVRKLLSFVGRQLAVIRDPLALISDVISSGSEQFASSDLSLTPREGLLPLVKRASLILEPTGRISTVLSDHTPP